MKGFRENAQIQKKKKKYQFSRVIFVFTSYPEIEIIMDLR